MFLWNLEDNLKLFVFVVLFIIIIICVDEFLFKKMIFWIKKKWEMNKSLVYEILTDL